MKPPTQAELIELEDWLSYEFREPDSEKRNFHRNPMLSEDSAIDRIRLLIAIARDPSQLLRTIPDDEGWSDADLESIKRDHAKRVEARLPPRKASPEPVPSLQPKQNSKSKNR